MIHFISKLLAVAPITLKTLMADQIKLHSCCYLLSFQIRV